MAGVINITPNWFTFGTAFDPVTADKVKLRPMVRGSGRLVPLSERQPQHRAHDLELCLGLLGHHPELLGIDGTLPIYDPNIQTDDKQSAAAASGFFASLDFNRTSMVARPWPTGTGPGATPSVYNGNYAAQLVLNKVNF